MEDRYARAGLLLAALAVLGLGALMERSPFFEDLEDGLRGDGVPTALLDSGTLGTRLRDTNLVAREPNPGERFPVSFAEEPEPDPLVFRRKSRPGDYLYVANPGRRRSGPDSALPASALEHGNVWIVSVAIRPEDLSDPQRGLLHHRKERLERAAHVSLYRAGERRFEASVGFKLHGGASRARADMPGFRLHFREDYGTARLPPGLLFDGRCDPISTVVVRPTQSLASCMSYTIAELLGARTPGTQPALLYLNGELRGVCVLTEHLSRRQYRARLGHEQFALYRVRGITDAHSRLLMGRMREWALDLRGHARAAEVARYIDLERLTPYLATVAFCGTEDWQQGAAVLDLSDPGDRWTWVLWDLDRSFRPTAGHELQSRPWRIPALGLFHDERGGARMEVPAILGRALLDDDPEYRDTFVRFCVNALNHRIPTDALLEANRHYAALYFSIGKPPAALLERAEFLKRRADFLLEDLAQRFDLGEVVELEVLSPPQGPVAIEVDGLVRTTPYVGRYFTGQEVELELPTGVMHWLVGTRPVANQRLVLELEAPTTSVTPVPR